MFGDTKGVPIKKPWSLACNVVAMRDALHRTCDRQHVHAPCAGRDTKETEGYTDSLVDKVHECFLQYCDTLRSVSHDILSAVAMPFVESANPQPSLPTALRCPPALDRSSSATVALVARVWPMASGPKKTGVSGSHAPKKPAPPPAPKSSWTQGLPKVGSPVWLGGPRPGEASSSAAGGPPAPPKGPPPQWALPGPAAKGGGPMAPPVLDPRANLKAAEESEEEAEDVPMGEEPV